MMAGQGRLQERAPIAVIVPARLALPWARRCLESIAWQVGATVDQIIYVDDASPYSDRQLDALRAEVDAVNGVLVVSPRRGWQVGSVQLGMAHVRDPDAIVAILDGDDYLLPHALLTVTAAYRDPEVAMTYGSTLVDFRPYQDPQVAYFGPDKRGVNTPIPGPVWAAHSFRSDDFRCFHLRTFRRWLFDLIDPAHFRAPDGSPFRGSGDSAWLYPMLELLGESKHVRFIEDPIHVYRLHERCVHVLDKAGQHDGFVTLRSMAPYPPLERRWLARRLADSKAV